MAQIFKVNVYAVGANRVRTVQEYGFNPTEIQVTPLPANTFVGGIAVYSTIQNLQGTQYKVVETAAQVATLANA